MILRGFIITTAALVALVAYVGYVEVPQSMEDRYRALMAAAVYRLLFIVPYEITDWLGYGSFFERLHLLARHPEPDLSKPPLTASYGILNVTRDKIAGLDVIVYRPKDLAENELLPGHIYFHGGGWAMHHPDFHDKPSFEMANCTRHILINVDYRLAGKHPFPAPLEDCIKITKHVLKHGKSLGINSNNLGISGDSTGGNLAAAVVLSISKEKNSGLPPIKYQMLVFAPLQAIDFRTPSYVEVGEIMFPPSHRMAGFWAHYMGLGPKRIEDYALIMKYNRHVPPELLENSEYAKYLDRKNLPEQFRKPRPEVMKHYYTSPEKAGVISSYDAELYDKIKDTLLNPLFAPLMASESDLKRLPPTFVIVSEFDVMRDDGLLYAHRLREAGVKTDVYVSKGHHSDFFPLADGFFRSRTGLKTCAQMCSYIARESK